MEPKRARDCGDEDIEAGRGPGQVGWYQWLTGHVHGKSVLDAGCGLGYGIPILRTTARTVRGQDVDPQLASPDITIGPLSAIPSQSVEVVVCVDVVEHIPEDSSFVAHLCRIARESVYLTTPNWTAGRCVWPYHVREYTPAQLRSLCEPFGDVTLWKGTPFCDEVHPIRYRTLNDAFNTARALPLIKYGARVLNTLVPSPARIHSHLAIQIQLS